jgi:hypothetical protein
MLETPVAFLIFNRPDTTARVFAEIARAKPKRLLVVADGPRADREGEAEKCAAVRAIIERVDWDCEVLTNYSDVNLGCKRRISTGLDWVFENCEEAIILEDDCLPHPSFFRYCEDLLEKYRDDERVMMISGNNFQFGRKRGDGSYYFSCYPHIWGWASWRRAWNYYDVEMKSWPDLRWTNWLKEILQDQAAVKHWQINFDKCFANEIDTWDIQFIFTCWVQKALAVLPNVNLVSNIGFGIEATHTKNDIYGVANLQKEEIRFPLLHPNHISQDREADRFTFENIFAKELNTPSLVRQAGSKLLSTLPPTIRDSITSFRFRKY